MKTIVFAYSEFGCIGIEALLVAGYDIAAVFTYRDDPKEAMFFRSVTRLCEERNLPVHMLEVNDAGTLALLQGSAPDYVFSFCYRDLLPDTILELARKGAYNLHPSLLPHYRGRAPINWVLVKGEKVTGVTLHHMITRADAGDIVAQKAVDIAYEDTALTLQKKLWAATTELLTVQLPLIAQGRTARLPQDISRGNYWGRRRPDDGLIDWSQPAETVRNLVRAVTQPYPGAFTYAGECKLLIWDSSVDVKTTGSPGAVLSVAPLMIACGEGALIVKAGQMEGGPYLSGEQLAQELQLKTGMRMSSQSMAA